MLNIPPYYSSVLKKGLTQPEVIRLALEAEIVRLGLNPGDPFPLGVEELAKTLRTSKATVILAMRDMAAEGILEIRQGKRVIVLSIEKLQLDEPSQTILFNVRTDTDALLGYWAAKNAKENLLTDEDLFQMENELITQEQQLVPRIIELEKMGRISSADPEVRNFALEYLISDVRFHTSIRRSAHDKWVAAINEIVEWQTYLKRLESYYLKDFFEVIRNSTVQHREIFEAIRDGDAERAMTKIREHLKYARSLAGKTSKVEA